ncbi:Pentatricopeptide repeat-containing protein [Camellia lanceoleosa]|uniref:Pentatricopeptide repeat-containing protein n=1 Tax=Camellia lanceoleosa TaxID=1840588 RepID=A0ACC0HAH6_9ERIC|nr:Pentatricopeptide repeat-containing protein [Camellia lanceoleosa]
MGCSRITSLSCPPAFDQKHYLVEVRNVSYFNLIDEDAAFPNINDIERCKEICLLSCSCGAVFSSKRTSKGTVPDTSPPASLSRNRRNLKAIIALSCAGALLIFVVTIVTCFVMLCPSSSENEDSMKQVPGSLVRSLSQANPNVWVCQSHVLGLSLQPLFAFPAQTPPKLQTNSPSSVPEAASKKHSNHSHQRFGPNPISLTSQTPPFSDHRIWVFLRKVHLQPPTQRPCQNRRTFNRRYTVRRNAQEEHHVLQHFDWSIHSEWQVHGYVVKSGFEFNLVVGSSLAQMYMKSGRLGEGERVIKAMPIRNVVACNTLIAGRAQNGFSEGALDQYNMMKMAGFRPDKITFVSVISSCSELATLGQGQQIHAEAIKTGASTVVGVISSPISMYSRCGCLDESVKAFL